jgi:hypothetical protein
MATVTPNFNWPVPTSTDLVKDGATAIEALGDSIDASLVDLKGGTTGQVLSKTSATDMDFTWVTSDDANAIQNTIVDAKGDLIAATAADTPARLAVGANDSMLVGDSTAATGLAYKSATTLYPWVAFTSSPANISVGNGTLSTRYQQIGKLVNVEVFFTLGSTSTVTGLPTFTLPVAAKNAGYTVIGVAGFGDSGVGTFVATPIVYSSFFYLAMIATGGTYAKEDGNINATTPFTWTTSDTMIARFTYEAA